MDNAHLSKSRARGLRDRLAKLIKPLAFLLILVVVITSLSMEAEARRRKKKRKSKQKLTQVINEPKLYERIGGAKGLSELVDEWMRMNLSDPRISSQFTGSAAHPERFAKMRKNLNEQLCELADGPCQYKGPEMDIAHKGMKITEEQFLAFAENLFRSMQKANIPEREKNEMLSRLDEYRGDVVLGESTGSGPTKAAN